MSKDGQARRVVRSHLLTIEVVAEELGVSTKTVRRLITSGALITHRIGRLVRVAEDDLARFRAVRRG